MIVEKMMKAWKLSNDNKKTIKENAPSYHNLLSAKISGVR